ncbi:UNVERIFIED_CONTAM: hypothetical protein RMT77_016501 [Armadillidium vulgare]
MHVSLLKQCKFLLVDFRMLLFFCAFSCVLKYGEGFLDAAVSRLPEVDMVHRAELDQLGSYVLLWNPREEDIVFEVQVRTKGYVGLGFSRTGRMHGSDIVIGWVDRDGTVFFSDRHASGHRTPVEDPSQDYELLGGYANDTHTVLRFSRPWVTCDSNHDFPLTDDTVRVIWAYDALPPDPSKTTLNYHDHRGTKSLYLRESKRPVPNDINSAMKWDVRAPNVELPQDFDTLYWCKMYKVPTLPWKYHMIGYEPLIHESSLPHVHHMLLYECTLENSKVHLEKWVTEKGAQCYSRNMPLSWNACGRPIVAWAIGSQGEFLPDHVGYPVGEDYGGATYFLLEIHYDNPEFKGGVVDNSGLRMYLTDKPRTYDAGVLTVGHKVEPSMIIPPRQFWTTTAHCTADCTQKTLPPDGIKVFSGILHAHLLGEALSLQLIRNGVEMEPLIIDNTYDFNYQQSRFFSEEKLIKPGDHLIFNCRYNATQKNKPTFGGFGTDDEMCLVFLSYYPRLNLGECYSRPDLAMLFDVFGIQNLYENDFIMKTFSRDHFDESYIDTEKESENFVSMSQSQNPGTNADKFKLSHFFNIINISEPASLRGKTFYQILTSDKTWENPDLVNRLAQAATAYQYEPSCLYSGRGLVEGLPKKAKIPHYVPYEGKDVVCRDASRLKEEEEKKNEVNENKIIPSKANTGLTNQHPMLEQSKFVQKKLENSENHSENKVSKMSRSESKNMASHLSLFKYSLHLNIILICLYNYILYSV